MKKIIMHTLLGLALSSTALAQAAESQFICENRMFREAVFAVDSNTITVTDSIVRSSHDVGAIVQKQIGLHGDLHIQRTSLVIARHLGDCDVTAGFLVNCAKTPEQVTVQIDGYLRQDNNNVVGIKLSVPAVVKDLKLKTVLRSHGPHHLDGNKTITIGMDQLDVDAEVQAEIDNQLVTLKWDVFFYTRETNNGSFCLRK